MYSVVVAMSKVRLVQIKARRATVKLKTLCLKMAIKRSESVYVSAKLSRISVSV